MVKKRTKFGIFILVITILFSLFIFFEEVMPYDLIKKQNHLVSNTLSDVINWFKGNSFYEIEELNLIEKGETLSGGEDIILGTHENVRLIYSYPTKKNSSPDLRISIDITDYIIDYSYQFKDDYLYLYLSGLKVGSTILTIENNKGKALDTKDITVVKEIENIPYDLELNATTVMKNDCLTFDYNFLSANQNILNTNGYKITDYYRDYYNYRDAYIIDGSSFYITNHMIFLLAHNSLSFTTDSEHIQINPTMGTIYIDKDCPSGIHTFTDNFGRYYSFEVLDQTYQFETDETKLNVITVLTGRYLIEGTINGDEFYVLTGNLPKGLTYSISFEDDCFYAIPSYYGDGNGGFYRGTGFYILTDDYSNNCVANVFTLNYDKNGNRLYSDNREVIIYTSDNQPINPLHIEMKTWSISTYYNNELISENQNYEIEVGQEYVFYIQIDGKELNELEPALTIEVSDSSILSVVVDVEASTITIKCLKLGSSTVTFGDYYKNPYSFSFKTGDSYFIEEVGGKSIYTFVQKNLGHFLCYVLFGLLLSLTMFTAKGRNYFTLKTLLISLGIAMTFGPIAESLQFFIPGRDLLFTDIILNLTASLIGVYIMILILFIIKRIKKDKLFCNEKDFVLV